MKFLINLFHRVRRESAAPPASTVMHPHLQPPRPGTRDPRPMTYLTPPPQGGHSTKCTACQHPQRGHIDQALMNGVPLLPLAKAHGLSKTALHRHKEHLTARLRQAAKALDETQQLDRLLCLARNLHRLEVRMAAAADAGDDKAMCRLNREMHRNLKAMDLIEFRFRSLNEAIVFQTLISPEWPDQVTALPTDPAILAAYRRLLVQGLGEGCPPPPKTAKPPKTRHHGAPAPSPVHPRHHGTPPSPKVPGLAPAAASSGGRPQTISSGEFRRQARELEARVKQPLVRLLSPASDAVCEPCSPAPLSTPDPDPGTLNLEPAFELDTIESELDSEFDFELNPDLDPDLNPEIRTLNSELAPELALELEIEAEFWRNATGTPAGNFPLTAPSEPVPTAPEKQQQDDITAINSIQASAAAVPKNDTPSAQNFHPAPAPAAPDLPADNQQLTTNNCPSDFAPANNQQLTTNNCPADFAPANNQQLTTNNCIYDSWDPAQQAEPLWTRPFLTPEEVASLPPTIPADILAIADIHPIFLKPYLDPKAEHLKGTPFREAPPRPEAPQAPEVPPPQPKPEPTRAEIMMDMTRRLSAMIRGEADEPVGPCRRPRRYSRRGHWDDW